MAAMARILFGIGGHQDRRGRGLKFSVAGVALNEFRRALAAEQRYENLKHSSATDMARENIARTNIARRIFEEFYDQAEPRYAAIVSSR
jgi:hypothetical protein